MGSDLWTRREMLAMTGAAGLAALGIAASRSAARPSHYRQKVLAKHPAAYWRLGEFSGPTAVDETKRQQDGTYHGDPLIAKRAPSAATQTQRSSWMDGDHTLRFLTVRTSVSRPAVEG